jgi:hypothetical protein
MVPKTKNQREQFGDMKSTRRHKKRQDESSGKKPTRAAQEHAVCQPGQSTISNPDTNPKKQTIFTGLLKPSQGRPPLSARDKLFLSRNIRRKPADLSIFCRSPFEKADSSARRRS